MVDLTMRLAQDQGTSPTPTMHPLQTLVSQPGKRTSNIPPILEWLDTVRKQGCF